jgi:TolB protein
VARLLRRVPIVTLVVMLLPGLNLTIETRAQSARAEWLIGYTELSTNLTGGRHANIITMRAVVSRADGTDRRLIAEELVREPNSWNQFAG